MTPEELDLLEARADAAAEWMQKGRMMPWNGFEEARDLAVEQVRALIAEVRRLRQEVAELNEDLYWGGP